MKNCLSQRSQRGEAPSAPLLTPVPAKPDTFAIFARILPFFPLSTSALSEFSVVFFLLPFSALRPW